MEKAGLAAILTIAAGGAIALQPPLLARLSDSTGTLTAAAANFVVGAVILSVLVLAVGEADSGLRGIGEAPWYYAVGGGLVGAIYVTTVVVTVGALGATGVVAATIAGQLAASVVLDRLGALGLDQQPITAGRLIGVGLLLAGTVLVVR